jgi:RNA polymerase sigma-70 factor (ECF subfamily)
MAADERTDNRDAADPRVELVREAIARLTPELQETLELRFEQELSYEEIAAVLEIPVGTVRSRLHNSVKRLREALCPEGIDP